MNSFNHWFPRQRVLYRCGAAADLPVLLQELGVSRPLLVCSLRAQRDPKLQSMLASFPAGAIDVFSGVEPHAPLPAAIVGAAQARAHVSDAIVAFGGGSASDLAKGIALALAEGDAIERFAIRREQGVVVGEPSRSPKVPIIALPNTLSGAEITPGFSLTRTDGYKVLFRDPALAAALIVLDPELIEDVPVRVLAGSAMNALAHCFEACYSKARTPISDLMALDGLRRLWRGLDARLDGGTGAEDLLLGSYLAGAAIVNARTALHHSICHKLGPMAQLSHGDVNSLVLPHALAFNLPHCPDETARIADTLGLASNRGDTAAQVREICARLRTFARRAGLPQQLRDTAFQREQMPELAARVMAEPGLTFNPRPIDAPEVIEQALAAAW